MTDTQIAVANGWAITTDGFQWIVQHSLGKRWRSLKFVRSTKDVLARCLREAGADPDTINALLNGLPDRFGEGAQTALDRGSACQSETAVPPGVGAK